MPGLCMQCRQANAVSHPIHPWQLNMQACQKDAKRHHHSSGTACVWRSRHQRGQPDAVSLARRWSVGCHTGSRLPLCRCGCQQRLRVLAQAEVGDGLIRKKAAFSVCIRMHAVFDIGDEQ